MTLTWSLFRKYETIELPTVRYKSRDPFKFVIPPYSLEVSVQYYIKLTARMGASKLSFSSFLVPISVKQSNIQAIISGGNERSLIAGNGKIILDASRSFDPDLSPELQTMDNKYAIAWHCFQLAPGLNPSCSKLVTWRPVRENFITIMIYYVILHQSSMTL